MSVVLLALAIVALVLAAIAEIQAQGRDLVAWAVICLAVIQIVGRLG